MNAVRILLMAAGLAGGLYGAWLLWQFPVETMIRIAIWAGAGVVLHDFVFAPLCAAFGFAGRAIVRGRWWKPVTVAALCTAVLVLLAIPVYTRPGAHADNVTVLDRNYPLGLWVSLAIVWACVPVYYLINRFLPVGQDEVVEQQRADDVERQPPAA
jgi:NADH:ubiquinone oxidoreductase subunit 6 (subunit J)